MFREMRLKNRELKIEEGVKILQNNAYGILSTISNDGYPYGVPVNYVYFNELIYFHCATEGYKLDNLIFNNKVSFCVVGETCILPEKFSTKYESVILFGRAVEVLEEEKNAALLEIIKKYSPYYFEQGKEYVNKASQHTKVIKIHIDHMSGKANE